MRYIMPLKIQINLYTLFIWNLEIYVRVVIIIIIIILINTARGGS